MSFLAVNSLSALNASSHTEYPSSVMYETFVTEQRYHSSFRLCSTDYGRLKIGYDSRLVVMVLGELCAVMDFTVMLQEWRVNSWDIAVTLIVQISKFISDAIIVYEHDIFS